MEKYIFGAFSVDKDQIQKYANKIYSTEAGIGSAEAKTYAFYYALKYGFSLNSNITFNKLIESSDCILKLIAYLYFRREKLDNYADQLFEQVEAMDETDQEKNWVYAYEVLSAEKIKIDFLSQLKKAKISFLIDEFRIK